MRVLSLDYDFLYSVEAPDWHKKLDPITFWKTIVNFSNRPRFRVADTHDVIWDYISEGAEVLTWTHITI